MERATTVHVFSNADEVCALPFAKILLSLESKNIVFSRDITSVRISLVFLVKGTPRAHLTTFYYIQFRDD